MNVNPKASEFSRSSMMERFTYSVIHDVDDEDDEDDDVR